LDLPGIFALSVAQLLFGVDAVTLTTAQRTLIVRPLSVVTKPHISVILSVLHEILHEAPFFTLM
jgi:hypothetical protein